MGSLKKQQSGVIGIIEIVLVVVLLGFAGFVVWKVVDTDKQTSDSQVSTTQGSESKNKAETAKEEEEAEEQAPIFPPEGYFNIKPVELTGQADIGKLPEETPASFVEFLKTQVGKVDENSCVTAITIEKIGESNVGGGFGLVNKDSLKPGDTCGGGARVVYYLYESSWKELVFQSILLCSDLDDLPVYSEFIEVCDNDDGERDTNPNGSIKDAL